MIQTRRYIIHIEKMSKPFISKHTLEESLSIPTGRCDLAIATHARKMHKKMILVVHPEGLDND